MVNLENITSEEIVSLADVALAREKLLENANNSLDNFESEKKALIDTIKEIGTLYKKDISDEAAEFAVMRHFEERMKFEEPKSSLLKKIAELYVDREKNWNKFGKKTVIGLTAAVLLSGTVLGGIAGYNCTRDSYLKKLGNSIESTIEEIRKENLPFMFEKKAQKIYNSAIESINEKNISSTRKYNNELLGIKEDMVTLIQAPKYSEELYNSIMSLVKEDSVKTRVEDLYSLVQKYVQSGDVENLDSILYELDTIEEKLNQEYTIQIVNKTGENTGNRRDYTDKNGKKISGYYLIVEAIDKKGNIVPVNIYNREIGRYEVVNKWGEQVSEELYNKISADKRDNGLLDFNRGIFGDKKLGYLEHNITLPGASNIGQITDWEVVFK